MHNLNGSDNLLKVCDTLLELDLNDPTIDKVEAVLVKLKNDIELMLKGTVPHAEEHKVNKQLRSTLAKLTHSIEKLKTAPRGK